MPPIVIVRASLFIWANWVNLVTAFKSKTLNACALAGGITWCEDPVSF